MSLAQRDRQNDMNENSVCCRERRVGRAWPLQLEAGKQEKEKEEQE